MNMIKWLAQLPSHSRLGQASDRAARVRHRSGQSPRVQARVSKDAERPTAGDKGASDRSQDRAQQPEPKAGAKDERRQAEEPTPSRDGRQPTQQNQDQRERAPSGAAARTSELRIRKAAIAGRLPSRSSRPRTSATAPPRVRADRHSKARIRRVVKASSPANRSSNRRGMSSRSKTAERASDSPPIHVSSKASGSNPHKRSRASSSQAQARRPIRLSAGTTRRCPPTSTQTSALASLIACSANRRKRGQT